MLALNQGEGLGIKIHAFVRWVVRQRGWQAKLKFVATILKVIKYNERRRQPTKRCKREEYRDGAATTTGI